jgi:hypothetical protein
MSMGESLGSLGRSVILLAILSKYLDPNWDCSHKNAVIKPLCVQSVYQFLDVFGGSRFLVISALEIQHEIHSMSGFEGNTLNRIQHGISDERWDFV